MLSKPELKARLVSALEKSDEPLSNVAFNFNLRRYTGGGAVEAEVQVSYLDGRV